MNYRIVADSCCDLPPELRERLGIATVPLTMTLGEESFTDDETLDLPDFMERMRNCRQRIGSAAPSPSSYYDAFLRAGAAFAVTLSSNLSGSYSSAVVGQRLAEGEGANIHVFDSKSASSGELLIALKIRELLNRGMEKAGVVSAVEAFIREMKTYFVLDNLDNLMKSGRLGKIAGKIATVLGIKPIMGSDGDGNIAFFDYSRSEKHTLEKLGHLIEKSGRATREALMVISHCNYPELAEKLRNMVKKKFHFKEILVVPTGGVSSMYANDKGIVLAF